MTLSSDMQQWVGRTETAEEVLSPAPLALLAATLDQADMPDTTVPALAHWLYFLPRTPGSGIGLDGHAQRGGFLPPVSLPRRMWAGSEIRFDGSLRTGVAATKTSEIMAIDSKTGRSGKLVFVTVKHRLSQDGVAVVIETQHIVYRDAPTPNAAAPKAETSPDQAVWSRTIAPDPVLLFRYSALTFNGHRIHYDRTFCRDEEGYPGLVVHGPLTATLLMDLYLRHNPAARVGRFQFRAHMPLFDIHPMTVNGCPTPTGAKLWATNHEGHLAMTAVLEVA
ncbi:FAS1-like dehydratase domain-containing protein [Acidisoma cladoniae]|uniref:FAS1-like dehydratase domain-containing protein n=1 Tax=Acidisoma cladoniae TaxID=3040935 RepID=UPI00254BA1BC|nr:MaoC family dehydratase N-terminal domain-containing protein [Acidisoma sp. PAMC 29798]